MKSAHYFFSNPAQRMTHKQEQSHNLRLVGGGNKWSNKHSQSLYMHLQVEQYNNKEAKVISAFYR